MKRKRVLVTPLNWGLGHATRCVPIIKEFLKQGAEVFIAADGRSLSLLKKEFVSLTFIELAGYNINYPEKGSMAFKMILSSPKILAAIKREHEALEKIVADQKIDIVFSDNRYGCWSKRVHSIFMTHQINIQCPVHLKWFEPLLYRMTENFITKYDECWVPDFGGEENLSGKLSHQNKLKDLKFIGPLSRFNLSNEKKKSTEKYEVMIICSGPEPQRTVFEKIMIEKFSETKLKTVMVRGITEIEEQTEHKNNLSIISHAGTDEMQQLIESSSTIISRPGYSTIMDLVALEKKAICIPTPGQTEQEYLAEYLMNKGYFFSVSQNGFDLNKALKESKNYTIPKISAQKELPGQAIASVLSK